MTPTDPANASTSVEHVDPGDVFLSPHSDDICFSLGAFARSRRAGLLLTVFPVSPYVPGAPRDDRSRVREITRLRLAEEARFATECGLDHRCLDFEDSMARGDAAFNPAGAATIADGIEPALMGALMRTALGRRPGLRPWLFCPAGIGDHVDHLAVTLVIARNAQTLAGRFRIAYYEDLHYASDPPVRRRGLQRLARILQGHLPKRIRIPLGAELRESKLAMIGFYRSQLTPRISRIEAYNPGQDPDGPHEALLLDNRFEPGGAPSAG